MKALLKECGATGKTPNITIGKVTTIEHDKKAMVEITGDKENPVLNFYIPKGKDGAKLILRESFNGDIQIINNIADIPENVGEENLKKVLGVNGIKEIIDNINSNETEISQIKSLLDNKIININNNSASIELINNVINELESSIDENTRDIEILKANVGSSGGISSEAIFLLDNKISANKQEINNIIKLVENNKKDIDLLKSSNGSGNTIDFEAINRLDERVTNIKREIDTLRTSFENEQNSYNELKETVANHTIEINKLKESGQGSSGQPGIDSSLIDELKGDILLNTEKINENTDKIDTLENTVIIHAREIEKLKDGSLSSPSNPDGGNSDLANDLENTKAAVDKLKKENEELKEEIESLLIYSDLEGEYIKEETTNSKIKVNKIFGKSITVNAPTEQNPDHKLIKHLGSTENKLILVAKNKNLFDITDKFISVHNTGQVIKESASEIILNSPEAYTNQIYYYIELKPNTRYTISANIDKMDIKVFKERVQEITSSNLLADVSISEAKSGVAFTTSETGVISIRISNNSNTGDNICRNLMIEEGEIKTSYVEPRERIEEVYFDEDIKSLPYTGQDSIELREDGFYFIERIRKVQLTKNAPSITKSWETPEFVHYNVALPNDVNVKYQSSKMSINILCNTKPVKDLESSGGNNGVWYSTNSIGFAFPPTMDSVEKFKNWLDENPTEVCVLTKEERVRKIELSFNLKSFKGLSHIYLKNDVKAKINVSVSKSISKIIKDLNK